MKDLMLIKIKLDLLDIMDWGAILELELVGSKENPIICKCTFGRVIL